MKRAFVLTTYLIMALFIMVPQALRADDTEIYGTVGVSVQPNVLIIFDTSGSMSTVDVVGEEYDPGTTYSGPYPINAVYRSTWFGWSKYFDNVYSINCTSVKNLLLQNGYCREYIRSNSNCGGTRKHLRLGNYMNYEASGLGTKRSRIAVAKEVITDLLNDTNNVRFGLMRFNNDQGGRVLEACGTDTDDLIDTVNDLPASGWTPLAETLAEAGLYFAGMPSWYNTGTYSTPMQERCQKNYIILMTDGASTQDKDWHLSSGTYINGDTIGDYDDDNNDPGYYSSDGSDYLDDVAKYLYENDCNPTLGTGTSFEKQNVITFTIGFKTEQQLLQDTALNGGGEYYTAQNITGLSEAFEQIMAMIVEENAVFVAPVVPVSRMNRTYAENRIYVGFFKPQQSGRWFGNLKKYGLDDNGELIDADGNPATMADGRIKDNARSYWSAVADGANVAAGGAGEALIDQTSRNLYTYMNSQSLLTHTDNAFSKTNSLITNSVLGVGSDSERENLIDDIHGEGRFWIFGDILHSEPAIVHYETDSYIFTGGNDSVMHCVADSDGRELWGFIPPEQLTRLPLLLNNDHDYFVDGSPKVYDNGSQKILFFGERRGGNHYYALDVTTPAAPQWLYQVNPTILGSEELGQSWVRPTVGTVKTAPAAEADVFLLAGGYDNNQDQETPSVSDSLGRAVYTVQAANGNLSVLNYNATNYADMTHCIVDVTGFDTSADGCLDSVYAGDLGGNMFAFEDHNKDGSWGKRKLFSASAGDGVQRKIFYSPDAINEVGGEMLFFGTGDRADPEETDVVNRLYAVKNEWTEIGSFTTITEADLVDVTYDLIQMGTAEEKAQARANLDTAKGWYIRLEHSGEKVTAPPSTFGGVVYFTTYTPDYVGVVNPEDPCDASEARGTGRLYAVDCMTGAAVHNYSNITEIDGEGQEVPLGKLDRCQEIGAAIPSAPVIAILESGPKMYIGIEGGVAPEDPIATHPMNVFYWRQIY